MGEKKGLELNLIKEDIKKTYRKQRNNVSIYKDMIKHSIAHTIAKSQLLVIGQTLFWT